jgi:hypothetical protein
MLRQDYQWLIDDLSNLEESYLQRIAKKLMTVCIDINVLDSFRFRLEVEGGNVNKDSL